MNSKFTFNKNITFNKFILTNIGICLFALSFLIIVKRFNPAP